MWLEIIISDNFAIEDFFLAWENDNNLELLYINNKIYFNQIHKDNPFLIFGSVDPIPDIQMTELNDIQNIEINNVQLNNDLCHFHTIDLDKDDTSLPFCTFIRVLMTQTNQSYFKINFHHIRIANPTNCQFSVRVPTTYTNQGLSVTDFVNHVRKNAWYWCDT